MGGQPWALPNTLKTITKEWMSDGLVDHNKNKPTARYLLNIQLSPITEDMNSEELGQALLRIIKEIDKNAVPGIHNSDPPAPKQLCTHTKQEKWQGGFIYNAGDSTTAAAVHQTLNYTCLQHHHAVTRFTTTRSSAQQEFRVPEQPKRNKEQIRTQKNGKEARLSGNLASFQ